MQPENEVRGRCLCANMGLSPNPFILDFNVGNDPGTPRRTLIYLLGKKKYLAPMFPRNVDEMEIFNRGVRLINEIKKPVPSIIPAYIRPRGLFQEPRHDRRKIPRKHHRCLLNQ